MTELDPQRLAAFAARLLGQPTARVTVDAIWRDFAEAFPGREAGASERRLLATALVALAADGVLRLPAAASWDRGMEPPLPRWVHRLVVDAPAASSAWRELPWHPRLAWVPDLVQLSAAELAFLERVQLGLVAGWFTEVAPAKYRSLQLTGHEKALGKLVAGRLFAAGRLDLSLLGCRLDPTPLTWTRVGGSRLAVVFENAGSYAVARQALRTSPYGVIVFGDGNRFERSVLSLGEIDGIDSVHYVGDLDGAGLRIACSSARRAHAAGLPPITAATRLHAAMLGAAAAFGHPGGWPASTIQSVGEAIEFLAEPERGAVTALLANNARIPEEVLGPGELRAALAD